MTDAKNKAKGHDSGSEGIMAMPECPETDDEDSDDGSQFTPKSDSVHEKTTPSIRKRSILSSSNHPKVSESGATHGVKPVHSVSNEGMDQEFGTRNDTRADSAAGEQGEKRVESSNSVEQPQGNFCKTLVLCLFWVGLPSFIVYLCCNAPASSCDMKIAENRNFTKYYGVADMKTYFDIQNADECSSSIIFRPALPQMILKADHSASSFLTLAPYGTGKTLLRYEYYKSLSSNDYFKILISNQQVTKYLDRFISETGVNVTYCETHNCLINWSANEFAQLLLSTLVTEFINTFEMQNLKGNQLSLDEKISLITIAYYYYNDKSTEKLASFVNLFLEKGIFGKYELNEPEKQKQAVKAYADKQLLSHLQEDLKNFIILPQDYERMLLLMFILKGEGFEDRALHKHLYGNTFGDLTEFSSFIKKYLKRTPVFVVDSIDEIKIFFGNNGVNSAALESFGRSSVSQSILSIVMTGNFHLSVFYPKIDNVNIEDVIIRKEKFPTHTIEWNTKSLINYADYVLEEINKRAAKTRCKPLPDFKTLVNYSNEKVAEIINKISTLRAFQLFIMALVKEMESAADFNKDLYQASFTNVDNAYRKSFETFEKEKMTKTTAFVGDS